ncbi:hypothetical protein FM109_01250 [Vibrio casei]|nr:hypothetical protein FM109_01250 [Vibrio casei]
MKADQSVFGIGKNLVNKMDNWGVCLYSEHVLGSIFYR